ncbi:hypothetical protein KZO77_05150 [Prevotella melaninogenica]|uniref:Uncharacterized protein n=1 Tax=Prevotella melaninogenica TaxID=28132 RepID=A0ABS6Y752_9BACT|nr:hypothetical protein [Prevotella melaninogenica]MBW4754430.1 hypothetical protein [Prevotella melaninogenica]
MNKVFSYTEVLKLLLWKVEKCDKNTSRIGIGMFNNVCRSRSWGSLAEIGEVVYSVGSLGEIFLDFVNGEYGKAGKKVSMCLDEN